MKVMLRSEFEAMFRGVSIYLDEQDDGTGQIVFYTGWYEWKDGILRDEPENVATD